jgi:putative protease
VPASALNSARRYLTEEIGRLREEHFSRTVPFDGSALDLNFGKRSRSGGFEIRVNACRAEQLERIDGAELMYLPLDLKELKKAAEFVPTERLGAAMPRFTFDENHDTAQLKLAAEIGIRHVLCTNYAHIVTAKRLGLIPHAAAGLNTANSLALKKLSELGVSDSVASAEMKAAQINALSPVLPVGVTVYGRLPLMLTANCPIAACAGCKNCTGRIYDRTGREFPVKCSKRNGYVEILNSDILCVSDKLSDFGGADFIQIELYDESPRRAAEILNLFKSGSPYPFGGAVTRGLYYRGLKN